MNKDVTITIAGPLGTGKTTVAAIIAEKLTGLGYEVHHTEKPKPALVPDQYIVPGRNIIIKTQHTVLGKLPHEELEELAKPLVDWLYKHGHPHCQIVIDQTSAELLEGRMTATYPPRG